MIFVQTNAGDANAVVAYGSDLEPRGTHATGGRGTGRPHLPSQGSVVAADGRLLVANAGSGDVGVLALDDLRLLGTVPAGGGSPVSIAARGETAWVLNGGPEPSIGELALGARALVGVRPL